MRLTFIGADHEVTGSCHYLEACGKHILVDYGMEQGSNKFENAELPIAFSDVDYVLLTHAHIDHAGLLPLIYAKGFKGVVFATEATCDLCNIMLEGQRPHSGDGGGMEEPEGKAGRQAGGGAALYRG